MSGIPDVVVVVPGIGGSVLARDGKEVWAVTPGAALRAVTTLGGSIRSLALDGDDPLADDLGDGVRATRVMPDFHWIPGLDWKIDGYGRIGDVLVDRLELTPGENFFAFPYDWRRDVRAAARALARSAHGWLAAWRDRTGNAGARLVLVGHSMGGLVARYFVEALEGWRDTRALVSVATPFYGSLNAVDFLANGMRKGVGPIGVDLGPLLRTFTAVHQLVPVYRCVERHGEPPASPSSVPIRGWQPVWAEHLRGFHRETEEAAAANREDPRWEEAGVRFVPIVGTDQPTRVAARLDADGTVEVLKRFDGKDTGGDGTVPRVSAALSGTEPVRMFAAEKHSRLQNNDAVLTHLATAVAALFERPIASLVDERRAVRTWFAVDTDDAYVTGEPVVVRAAVVSDPGAGEAAEVDTHVSVTGRDPGGVVRSVTAVVDADLRPVDLGPLPAGVYTLRVRPVDEHRRGRVDDVLVVVPAAGAGE